MFDMKDDLSASLEFISRVESGEISVAVMFAVGRSGTTLVHSFLDGHPNLLILPTMFPYYVDWQDKLKSLSDDLDSLVDTLIYKTSFSRLWFNESIESSLNTESLLPLDEIAIIAKKILRAKGEISSRSLLLATHCAYAVLEGINLFEIRCIVIHHHYIISDYLLDYKDNPLEFSLELKSSVKDRALQDFPNLRIIYTIRHPYALFASVYYNLKNERCPVDLSRFITRIHSLLYNFKSLDSFNSEFSGRIISISYEKLHLETRNTLENLAKFIEIPWDDSLQTSTIAGNLWFGNNPLKRINGANSQMAKENWHKLPRDLFFLIKSLFSNINPHGYVLDEKAYSKPFQSSLSETEIEAYFNILLMPLSYNNQLLELQQDIKLKFVNEYWRLRAGLFNLGDPGFFELNKKQFYFFLDVNKCPCNSGDEQIPIFIQPWGDKSLQVKQVLELKARGYDVWLRDALLAEQLDDCLFIPYFAIPGKTADGGKKRVGLAIGRRNYALPPELEAVDFAVLRLDQQDAIASVQGLEAFKGINPYHYQAQWRQLLAGFDFVYLDDIEDPWQVELGLTVISLDGVVVRKQKESFYFTDDNSIPLNRFSISLTGRYNINSKKELEWDGIYSMVMERIESLCGFKKINSEVGK